MPPPIDEFPLAGENLSVMAVEGDYFEVAVPVQMVQRWAHLSQGWKSKHIGNNIHRAILEENYKDQVRSCIDIVRANDVNGFIGSKGLPRDFEAFPPLGGNELAQAQAQIRECSKSGEPARVIMSFKLRLTLASPDEVVGIANELLRYARGVWKDSSLWWVSVSEHTRTRTSLLRLLFAADQAPETLGESASSFKGFEAAKGFSSEYHLHVDSLIKTFLLLQSPYPLGYNFFRPDGQFVLLFGEGDTSKRSWGLMELLLESSGYVVQSESLRFRPPVPTAPEVETAFRWWVSRIDRLLQVVQDPANYKVKNTESYSPSEHLCHQLGLERFFNSVRWMLANYSRDDFGRLCFFFDAQDIAQGLAGWDPIGQQTAEKWVDKEFWNIASHVEPEARLVTLGLLETGILALREAKQGFYRQPQGGAENASIGDYIRLVRNSHHSFSALSARDKQMLASHTGVLPADLPHLALLYLLIFLTRPEVLFPARKRYAGTIRNPRGQWPTDSLAQQLPETADLADSSSRRSA